MMGTNNSFAVGLVLVLAAFQHAAAETNVEALELIGEFRFAVKPSDNRSSQSNDTPRSLVKVNQLRKGDTIILSDLRVPNHIVVDEDRQNMAVALFVVPAKSHGKSKNGLKALKPKPVFITRGNGGHESAESKWKIPYDVSMVGVVFAPDKWRDKWKKENDAKKVTTEIEVAIKKKGYLPIITQIANYSDLKAEGSALDLASVNWETSANTHPLDVVLKELSSRYNVAIPDLPTNTPPHQKVTHMLRAVIPDLMGANRINPQASNRLQQVASISASLTGFFAPGVGPLAMGLAAFGKGIRNLFPKTVFLPVLIPDYSPRKHKMSIPACHVEQDQGVAGHLQKKSETRRG